MSTATNEKTVVEPWGIRADHPRNSDLLLQCVPGARLRSTIKAARPVRDAHSGEMMIPVDQSRALSAFPEVPGMEIHINPAKLTYVITDPLEDDEQLCDTIRRRLKATGFSVADKVKGVPQVKGTLDKHSIKSLCREMVWLVNASEAVACRGPIPTLEQVEQLPGEFLLNPGSRVMNTQPRFEKDFPGWVDNLTRSGG